MMSIRKPISWNLFQERPHEDADFSPAPSAQEPPEVLPGRIPPMLKPEPCQDQDRVRQIHT